MEGGRTKGWRKRIKSQTLNGSHFPWGRGARKRRRKRKIQRLKKKKKKKKKKK